MEIGETQINRITKSTWDIVRTPVRNLTMVQNRGFLVNSARTDLRIPILNSVIRSITSWR